MSADPSVKNKAAQEEARAKLVKSLQFLKSKISKFISTGDLICLLTTDTVHVDLRNTKKPTTEAQVTTNTTTSTTTAANRLRIVTGSNDESNLPAAPLYRYMAQYATPASSKAFKAKSSLGSQSNGVQSLLESLPVPVVEMMIKHFVGAADNKERVNVELQKLLDELQGKVTTEPTSTAAQVSNTDQSFSSFVCKYILHKQLDALHDLW